jgi:hypothetical protein
VRAAAELERRLAELERALGVAREGN